MFNLLCIYVTLMPARRLKKSVTGTFLLNVLKETIIMFVYSCQKYNLKLCSVVSVLSYVTNGVPQGRSFSHYICNVNDTWTKYVL